MSADTRERGFDFGPFPSGWAQVAWSKELPRGQVRSVLAFGQRLVLFRGADGVARVLDAYCPHLGADLGVGGTVVGNRLRCPFHGWQFDGKGVCVAIPQATGNMPFIVFASTMPIDADTIIHRMTFMVPTSVPAPLRGVIRGIAAIAARREFERDIPIWESKICRPRPVLCDADGPIARFRSWSRQFLGEGEATPIAGGRRLPVIA